ncbi:Lrp/AsnC family transcriptional regulator [Brevibacillus borstelensis]|uniref:Lrp/AsnC family transcriptional regulator n=1 Tax=Brevibacillus borstelensis TaxID=45462 RepID=UPI0030C087E1
MTRNLERLRYSELDDLDYGIAKALQDNARLPFTQIAKELGVTEKTVRMRVQQMQDAEVLSLIGMLNPAKAGLTLSSLIQLAVEAGRLDEAAAELQDIDEVREIVLTSGEYQIMIQVLHRDHEELSCFLLNRLNKIPGIVRMNVIHELKSLKSSCTYVR